MRLWLVLVPLLSGCIYGAMDSVGNVGAARFAPQDRAAAWGRALEQVQRRGGEILWCSYESGVMRARIHETAPCAHGRAQTCASSAEFQITIFDGLAALRSARTVTGVVSGISVLLEDEDRETMAGWDAQFLASIAGMTSPATTGR